ncbi:hypothetical protein BDP55DRAFT_726296 [Colletotrichum godetiae]|uniref:Uncharacterized protein n=1 Tax=Colletotrichum godetiae TaxID=1209918 RepID=A0AAJ0ARC1_9PEZI|nr:uncharacterized protein BDP55DRAFT_726296 [Colletotrichum godetiae]KAK1688950.1 hypothetical protein BDP55DRAFT_726296 [Colletotrichum godetiae]
MPINLDNISFYSAPAQAVRPPAARSTIRQPLGPSCSTMRRTVIPPSDDTTTTPDQNTSHRDKNPFVFSQSLPEANVEGKVISNDMPYLRIEHCPATGDMGHSPAKKPVAVDFNTHENSPETAAWSANCLPVSFPSLPSGAFAAAMLPSHPDPGPQAANKTADPALLQQSTQNASTVSLEIPVKESTLPYTEQLPQRHYLGRNISADLWGVLRGQKPQQALVKQSCSIDHSISERRPTGLTTEQSASVATHPTIRELTKALRELPQGSKQYNQVKRARRNEKQRLRREPKQRIRDEWSDKQATDDIERQIHGIGFDNPATDNTCRPQGTAQRQLMKKLTAPIVTTLEGQYRRRDEAIEAVSTYCLVQEGCTVPRSRPRSTPEAAVIALLLIRLRWPVGPRHTICFHH